MDRQINRQIKGQRGGQTDRRQTYKKDRQIEGQTERRTNRKKDRQMN